MEEKGKINMKGEDKKTQGEENAITVPFISRLSSCVSCSVTSLLSSLLLRPACFLEVLPLLALPDFSIFYCSSRHAK